MRKSMRMQMRIIENCAPTLAGMKSASLFSYEYGSEDDVKRELREINEMLNDRGVTADILAWRDKSVLIYVYRPRMLAAELKCQGVAELLRGYGYCNENCNESCNENLLPGHEFCLRHLKKRVQCSECFPHEIGVFLGYPLEDVHGFIKNEGRNCESCGMWKVYCNREEKDRIFQKFRKCKDVYMQVFQRGRELSLMTVCA